MDESKEELADVLEVVNAILDFKKTDFSEIERIRKSKARERGTFKGRIIADSIESPQQDATAKDLQLATVKRSIYSSKTGNGKIVIVGGSERYHGSPALASSAAHAVLAALRVGIGYAVEYAPKSVTQATRSVSPDLIVMPLSGNNLSPKDIPMLARDLKLSGSLVIGPGIGRRNETAKAVIELIDRIKGSGKKCVIDADALYALAKSKKKLGKNFIITPNQRELKLFYDKDLNESDTNARKEAAIRVSKALDCVVLLKGHETVVTDGKRTKIIRAKSSALAVMGTGDVLSGMIGAYAAKNNDLFVAGVAGAYLHAMIGDALYKEKGNHILASDVVDGIPKILKKFDK